MLSLPDPCDTQFLEGVLGPRRHRGEERRRFDRRPVAGTAVLAPLTLDGPDFSRAVKVHAEDISRGGAAIVTDRPPLGPHWAISIDAACGESIVMEVTFRDFRRREDGRFRIACQFLRRLTRAA